MRLPFFLAHCSHHCSSIHFHHLSSLTLFSSSAKTNRWPRMDSAPIFFIRNRPKEKVIVTMGTTGAGKSSLSIDLATRSPSLKSSTPIKCKSTEASISPPARSPLTTQRRPSSSPRSHPPGERRVHAFRFPFVCWLCHPRIDLNSRKQGG